MNLDRPPLKRLIAGLFLFFVAPSALADLTRSGSWADVARDGEGYVVQYIDDATAVVYWFTYDEDGNQRWFIGTGTMTGNRLEFADLLMPQGGVFGPGFDPGAIENVDVGELVLTFESDDEGLAEYTINGVAGTQNITRITRPVEVSTGTDASVPRKSGAWFDPTRDGEGVVVEILPDGRPLAYWFTYDIDGNQAWMLSLGESDSRQGSFLLDMLKPTGGRFGPNFDPADVIYNPSGQTRVSLQCTGGYGDFVSTDAEDFVDIRFNLQQIVGIGPNSCADPALVNLFPLVDGEVAIPDHEAGRALRWLLDLLASDEAITEDLIRERFSAGAIDARGLDVIRDLLISARTNYPAARLTDPTATASTTMTGLVTATTGREGFFVLEVAQSDGLINTFSIQNFGFGAGTVVSAADAALNLSQALDRFESLYAENSIVVARINEENQCEMIMGRNPATPRAIASIFKVFILGGVAEALDEEAFYHDDVVPLDGLKQVQGGPLFNEPAGLPFTIDRLATLMLGVSDNTATDMLLALAGRERFDGLHAEYGHQTPALMTPQLGISENFHLFFSFPLNDSVSYVEGTEAFRRTFLQNRIVPLGSAATGGGGFNHEDLYIDASWQAAPLDVCGAFARHRLHAPGSDAALAVERALQSGVAQPNLREHWDRIWYKGGSLASGNRGTMVLTHAWMLEREGETPYVVAGFANDPAGGIDGFVIQSILGRILELVRDL